MYKNLFDSIVQKLLQANATILNEETKPLLGKDEIEYYENEFSVQFPDWAFPLYSNLNGFYLTWQWKQENQDIRGGFLCTNLI